MSKNQTLESHVCQPLPSNIRSSPVVSPQPNASRPFSQQDILDDVPMYIGQSNVTAAEAVGQLLVVDSDLALPY